ncbi:MAG: hypothetical protein HZC47_05455 [Methanobacterium sp.]|uniref:hypothetical protein n=1 Tax=Methanobacterium sp. TaxID=2164 RepID=UPI003D64C5DE|nr:hypothetical protein [Methanobacterium sp.]
MQLDLIGTFVGGIAIKKSDNYSNFKDSIKGFGLVRLWVIILILVLAIVSSTLIWVTYNNTEQDLMNIANQINPDKVESGLTVEDYQDPATAIKVTSGIYVDRVKSLSIKDNLWTVDFYIWFKWKGDLNPGDSFQVIDGTVDPKDVKLIKNGVVGDETYALYKVTATITKKFDMNRFPVDDQFLTINIQDTADQRDKMIFVPDQEGSSVGSNVNTPGYGIVGFNMTEKPFNFNSTMGDPTVSSGTFSQLRTGILLSREDNSVLFVSLIGIFVAVLAALSSLFIMSFQGRFSMEGASMFVLITNMIFISNLVPTGVITVGHYVAALGFFIVAMCLVESSISIYYHKKGDEALARRLDLVTVPILALGFVVTVIAMIWAAW